jgi:hypothetical protein
MSNNLPEIEDLKNVIRDRLLDMTKDEQRDFIQALDAEMRNTRVSIRQYLIPLGISALNPDDMTPTEVGHLIRFLKINVPMAMPAIEKVLARFEISTEKRSDPDNILAA